MSNPPPTGGRSKTEILDAPLHAFGLELDDLSTHRVSGHLLVTAKCCQPFNVLHGGVSALIAEALASIGAYLSSGLKRVAGMQLSINHLRSAKLGDMVFAEATPVNAGKTIQLWEVRLWKCDPSNPDIKTLISSSRVTLYCNVSAPASANQVAENFRMFAKL